MQKKKFIHHNKYSFKELLTENIEGKRYYITENNEKFPSITTILNSFNKEYLDNWKNKIGIEESNRITQLSSSRGTRIHSLIEKYLNNENIDIKNNYDVIDTYNSMKLLLNNIDCVYNQEVVLYSNRLKIAGRCDCIGLYNNVLSIIDFKTSRKIKKDEWIMNYYLQCTFYALAWYELTQLPIKQLVIIMGVENENAQLFVKPIKNYIKLLLEKINNYKI